MTRARQRVLDALPLDESRALIEVARALGIDPDELEIRESSLASFGTDAYDISIRGGHKDWSVVLDEDAMHELLV